MHVLAKMNDRVADTAVTTPSSIRVAVIADDPISRQRVTRILKGAIGIEVVGEGSTVADALEVARELAPDVMLLNLDVRGEGTKAAAGIARVCPNVRTIILTASENERDVTMAVQAGARGYIMAGSSTREVVETVRGIVRDDARAVPTLEPRLLITSGEGIKIVEEDNLRDLNFREK